MKKCNNCGLEKPISEFYKNKRSKDGLQSNCKSCVKAYYVANKDERKAYREANKDEIKDYQKAWYEANKDERKAYKKAWYEDNKEKIKDYRKAWYEANKEKRNAQIKAYRKKRMSTDPLYKFKCDTRILINNSFTRRGFKKGSRTEKILCCTFEYLLEYLKPPRDFFTNRSNYHIDHIIPLSTAKTKKAVIRLCHYTNLRIITAQENLEKSDKTKTNLLELVAW